ncbi:ell-associated factor Eaf [Aplysia californica]|uniref:Ell-associated factor Eaf n=1 Tax=Aplysia californica TaxID=6500 RepID=A0ABM1VZ54_APLCA|nr:ell-associated factor Eaf [Aplysia californica]
MQHKISDTWKNAYDTDYPAMADDGVDTTTTTNTTTPSSPPIHGPNGVTNGPNSIVNGLLRKAGSFSDVVCSGGGSLEQKIQELRAEKEAGEVKKCPSSMPNDQDSPLDFSVKRRSSFSGSLSDDSQASSSSPGHVTDYNAVSPPPAVELGGSANHNGDLTRRATPSPGSKLDEQKVMGLGGMNMPPASPMPPLINGMGFFPGLPSNLLANGSAINAFSQMAAAAAFMDPRGKKNNRPFKAYPKEALQMPLGFFGLPGLTAAALQQGTDSGGGRGGMNSEEIMNMYNQQLQLLREKQLSASGHVTGAGKTSSPPSSQVQPHPSANTNHNSHNNNNSNNSGSSPHHSHQAQHHHQQHQHHLHQQQHHHQTQGSQLHPHHPHHHHHHHHQGNRRLSSSPTHIPSQHQQGGTGGLSPPSPLPRDTSDLMTAASNNSHHHHPHPHLSSNNNNSSHSSSSPPFPTPTTPLPPPSSSTSPSASMNTTLVSSTSSSSFAYNNSRKRPRSLPDDQKDAAYWERRRKNNDAAKRSRDARRAKEDEIAIRAALLEQENIKLRVEVAALKTETARLRCLLYNS